jgi:hypothetical protein
MMDNVIDFDPNKRWAKHRVRMTFGLWDYRVTLEEIIGGNCRGLDVLESAISEAYLHSVVVRGDYEYGAVTMTRANGDQLHCQDDDDQGETWLEDMLVGYEVVGFDEEAPALAASVEAA